MEFLRSVARFVDRLRTNGSLATSERPTVDSRVQQGAPAPLHEADQQRQRTDDAPTVRRIFVQRPSAPAGEQPQLSPGYTFRRKHKNGGLGSVWIAHDERIGRDVALKKLRRDLQNDADSQRFLRSEAQLTAQLQHPNIVPVYDVGLDQDGDFFYTMRLVHGQTLSEQIDIYTDKRSTPRLSPVKLRRLLDIFRGVCNAVAYAHSKNVVHLDLKPSNVLVGEFGEVILLDWGCAKRAGDDLDFADLADPESTARVRGDTARTLDLITGTPAYMAPEQIRGHSEDIGAATDIYQLGAMLYEILTAQPPHSQYSVTSVVRRVRGEGAEVDWAEQARRANAAAPPALAAICGRALSTDPKMRYQSVNELRNDVEHWMADEPVSVYRAGLFSRSVRWVRRHQKIATFALASVCAISLFNLQLLRLTVQDQCNRLSHALGLEMRATVGAVDAMESLFETAGDVTREEFGAFAGSYLERYEQLAGLEWVPVVPHADRAAYEAAVRDSAWPSSEVARRFRFTERSTDSRLVEAKSRDPYFPVYYLAPYEGNEEAFGYDLGSSNDRMETLRHANASGGLAISAPVELVQGSLGFLAISPVAHEPELAGNDGYRGYALGVFKADQVLASAWKEVELEYFSIRVYDVTDAPQIHLIWSNASSSEPHRPLATVSPGLWGARRQLSLWNREWRIVIRPKLSFVLRYPFSTTT